MNTCTFCDDTASVLAYDLPWCLRHLTYLYLGLCMVRP